MFETSFSHSSSMALPSNISIDAAIRTLHDFDQVVRLSPDCRGCRPLPTPPAKNGTAKINGATEIKYYEVEDDLPFIPKRMWSGGVKYQADFMPTDDGCDITVHAPGGFTSTNHWRLLRESLPEDGPGGLERVKSKDLLHAETSGHGWYVQIVSDARCSKTFAGFVKGFLKNSHQQLESNFIQRLPRTMEQSSARPTLGRRKSSIL